MTSFRNLGATTAIFTLMTTGGAFAEITAAQAWGDYKSYMEGFGYSMTSNETTSGDTITVTDLTITAPLPEAGGDLEMTYGELSFTSNNDGTVSMNMPSSMPFGITVTPKDDDPVEINLDYTQTGLSVIISGQPGDLVFTFSAASLGMTLTDLIVEGKKVDIGSAQLVMNSIAGSASLKSGNLRSIAESGTIGSLTYDLAFKDPEGEGYFNYKGALQDLNFNVALAMPMEFDETDMAAMMRAGFAVKAAVNHNGSTMNFDFADGGDAMKFDGTSTSGDLSMNMDEDRLEYALSSNDMALNATSSELPFPLSMTMAETAFKLLMPISKSDDEQDFAFLVNLGGFTVSDMLWSLIDAGGQLPRDPATIALDLTGKVKVFFDLMNPESAATVDADMPGQLNAVTLNSLTISAAGAEVTGSGDFTFDNTDLTTFDGIPAPTGAIDLKIVGANGLMDKLVAMGLLPEDQAMMGHMMMGMFAVPAGDDILTSKIEVTGDGQISANGQRLK
ncbi:MAG: DUF2125 domain-containing protein [Rhodobacterales bacterium]|nr:DUF2125 domain-containing protein [Rhodobacterales bacterium]